MLLILALLVSCGADKPEDTEIDAPELPPEPTATEGLVYAEDGLGGCEVIGYKGESTEIYIPDVYGGFNVTAVSDSAFRGNDLITEVTLGPNVKSIGVAAFAGCDSLVSVAVGESLEKVGSAAFFGCGNLKNVSLPSSLKLVGLDAFASCPSLDEINYNGNQSMWSRVEIAMGNDAFNTELVLAEGGALVKLIAEGDCNANIGWRLGYDGILVITGNGHIPDYAFDETPWGAYVESITSIVVEDGIDVIGKNCFIGCTEAVSVTLAQSVRLIDNGAFYNCSSLEEITLPDRLRRIGESAFFACSSLKSITVPDSVTAIGYGAFMKCTALESVTLSSGVSEIQRWTFAECHALKSLDLSAVAEIETNAFYNCKSLATLTFGDVLGTVADHAFRSCPRIAASGIPATAVIGMGNTSIK